MKIRSMKNAKEVVQEFEELFKFDTLGQKFYVFFEEKGTGNTLTLMKYPYGLITLNRKGKDLPETGETEITKEECTQLVWDNRAEINRIITLRMAKRK